MSYIGNTNTTQAFTPAIDFFSGNGSTTAFTLSRPVASVAQVEVYVSNVPQTPSSAYTVNGNTITFTSAPLSGTNNIYVYYTSPITQVIAPGQGTVAPTQIDASYSLWNKSGSDINYTAGNVGIGTTSTLGNSSLNVLTGITARTAAASGVTPYLQSYNGNAGTDLKTWRLGTQSTGNLIFETVNDAYSSSTSRMNLDSSGNLQFNSGYGSVATAYGCRAWVNFDGTGTVAIRASGNVTSITDNGAGDYTVNFTTAMPDANYVTIGSCNRVALGGDGIFSLYANNNSGALVSPTTTAARVNTSLFNNSDVDVTYVCVAFFR